MSLRKKSHRLLPKKPKTILGKTETGNLGDKLAIVVHTCDSYEFCWRGWFYYFNLHWPDALPFDVYFINEEVDVSFKNIIQIKTGRGEWSERLRLGLAQIPHEHILYLQEDVWLQSSIDILEILKLYLKHDIDRLQLSPLDKQYTLFGKTSKGKYRLRKFAKRSKYLVSHQPSIWNKEFLLECLTVDESPWDNEIEETKRLRARQEKIKIYLLTMDWYTTVSRKGKLTRDGLRLESQIV